MKSKVIIEINNTYSKLIFQPLPQFPRSAKEEIERVKNTIYLRLSYLRTVYVKSKIQKVRVSAYNKRSNVVLTGFIPIIKDLLNDLQIETEIIDKRNKPEVNLQDIELNDIKLRDYQIETIKKAIEHERGILDMSVGAGKTEVACGIIKALNLPTLFIVHTRPLLMQTKKRLESRLGEEIGLYGAGIKQLNKITVASIQSLYSNLNTEEVQFLLKNCSLIIVDEAHHISTNTYKKVLEQSDAYFRYGLSGTPLDREDDGSLYVIGILGNKVIEVGSKELVEQGYLSQPIVRLVEFFSKLENEEGEELWSFDPEIRGASWNKLYELGITHNKKRNKLICECTKRLLLENKKRIMIIVKEVEHGKELQKVMEEELRHRVPLVWSKSNGQKDKLELSKFEQGILNVIIASPIFDEGVDIPAIDAIIIAGGGKSYIKSVQRVGRGMRKYEGKENLIVVDFIDKSLPVLIRHSGSRIKTYLAENFTIYLWDINTNAKKKINNDDITQEWVKIQINQRKYYPIEEIKIRKGGKSYGQQINIRKR